MTKQVYLAAVDMGSNSFRCEIGRLEAHEGSRQIVRADYLKETVRLGGGLDKHGRLSEAAIMRGLACLERFAERIRGFHPDFVRAVATQTLREATNREEFVRPAEKILGFPIEVISGREEARLIYAGVANLLPDTDEQRLVIDIGGRSTEIILGKRLTPKIAESYQVGSVSLSQRYFPQGRFTEKAFEEARISAAASIEDSIELFSRSQWDVAYGSSGTVGAVAELLSANAVSDEVVTLEGLAWCREKLLRASSADKLKMSGLKDDRKAVIGGGIAILEALLQTFEIHTLMPAKGALRQGVLFDMLGRREEGGKRDLRHETVSRLQTVFRVDTKQAARVELSAVSIYEQLLASTKSVASLDRLNELRWACRLHELGMSVSHSEFHRHGAYIIEKADAAGFSQSQQQHMANLVLGHRGRLRKIAPLLTDPNFAQQLIALRLAAILCHARRDPKQPNISVAIKNKKADELKDAQRTVVTIDAAWLHQHPQSGYLLNEEVIAWENLPLAIVLLSSPNQPNRVDEKDQAQPPAPAWNDTQWT